MLTVFPIPTNIDYTASAMHAFYTFIGMFGIAKNQISMRERISFRTIISISFNIIWISVNEQGSSS